MLSFFWRHWNCIWKISCAFMLERGKTDTMKYPTCYKAGHNLVIQAWLASCGLMPSWPCICCDSQCHVLSTFKHLRGVICRSWEFYRRLLILLVFCFPLSVGNRALNHNNHQSGGGDLTLCYYNRDTHKYMNSELLSTISKWLASCWNVYNFFMTV